MLFKDVVGLENTKTHLIQTVKQQRISHAQLFLAQEGSGGLALALAYATYILCEQPTDTDACGKCPTCMRNAGLIHPDVHFVYPVATSKKVSKSPVSDDYLTEWREMVSENPYFSLQDWYSAMQIENKQGNIGADESESIVKKLNFKSFEGNFKIMIIWQASFMNESASNKLLKLIEEPPEKTLFLLITAQTESILATILSRTQLIKIPRLTESEISEALQSNYADKAPFDQLSHLVQGDYNKAIQVLNEGQSNLSHLDAFKKLMRYAYVRDYLKIQEWVEEMASLGREGLKQFFQYSLRMIRENFIKTIANDDLNYMSKDETTFAANFHKFIHSANAHILVKEFSMAYSHISQNGHAKIILLDLGIQVSKCLKIKANIDA